MKTRSVVTSMARRCPPPSLGCDELTMTQVMKRGCLNSHLHAATLLSLSKILTASA